MEEDICKNESCIFCTTLPSIFIYNFCAHLDVVAIMPIHKIY